MQKPLKEVEETVGVMPVRAVWFGVMAILAAIMLVGCADNKPLKYSTIHEAAAKGDLADVKRHLRRGAAVNEKDARGGGTPLHAAAEKGQMEVAKFLIDNGADVNAGAGWAGVKPLHLAIENGHTDMVKLLIDKGADVNAAAGGVTPLKGAMKQGHTEIAELLRKHGAREWEERRSLIPRPGSAGRSPRGRMRLPDGSGGIRGGGIRRGGHGES
jgi:hypothetical protein